MRRTGSLGDMALCVDKLDGLGVFLEVERMVPDGVPGEAVQAELSGFVPSLGPETAFLRRGQVGRWSISVHRRPREHPLTLAGAAGQQGRGEGEVIADGRDEPAAP